MDDAPFPHAVIPEGYEPLNWNRGFGRQVGPLFEKLRGAGFRVAVYTVNDVEEARRLMALGVDSIVTDAVDVFSPVGELPHPIRESIP